MSHTKTPKWILDYNGPRKSPFVALLLSIVPGLGQVYNGQVGTGILLFLLTAILYPIIVGFILHLWLFADAYRSAGMVNDHIAARRIAADLNCSEQTVRCMLSTLFPGDKWKRLSSDELEVLLGMDPLNHSKD